MRWRLVAVAEVDIRGGVGGPSIGILYQRGHAPLQDADIRTDEAGKGGLGGDPSVLGSAGEDGVRADTLGVPL